jgi:hypothetical protein
MAGTNINCLAIVLKELGWSYTRLIAELRRHSSIALPKTESMVTLISRWVNNHQQPDDFYRDLLSRRPAELALSCSATNRSALPRYPRAWSSPAQWPGSPQPGKVPSPRAVMG